MTLHRLPPRLRVVERPCDTEPRRQFHELEAADIPSLSDDELRRYYPWAKGQRVRIENTTTLGEVGLQALRYARRMERAAAAELDRRQTDSMLKSQDKVIAAVTGKDEP